MEHYKLLQHDSVKVRMWGIERGYQLAQILGRKGKDDDDDQDKRRLLSAEETRRLAADVVSEINNQERKLLPGPFEFVEAEVTVVEETPSE